MEVLEIVSTICDALNKMKQPYFNLKTTYEPNGIVRERVFCYELYHQMRKILGDNGKLTLNGEIDKRGHIDFQEEDRKNPDFVFHIPGNFYGNTIVCEVKGKINEEIKKDFQTLLMFINNYSYQVGIFILYNHNREKLIKEFIETNKDLKKSNGCDKIYILTIASENRLEPPILLSEI
jgi:hypothetical protein